VHVIRDVDVPRHENMTADPQRSTRGENAQASDARTVPDRQDNSGLAIIEHL
jgi:hypothetical protein